MKTRKYGIKVDNVFSKTTMNNYSGQWSGLFLSIGKLLLTLNSMRIQKTFRCYTAKKIVGVFGFGNKELWSISVHSLLFNEYVKYFIFYQKFV